jgi:hypothetical protein
VWVTLALMHSTVNTIRENSLQLFAIGRDQFVFI